MSADANGTRGLKWWIPTVKVPPNGLSEVIRKWIQVQKDSVNYECLFNLVKPYSCIKNASTFS